MERTCSGGEQVVGEGLLTLKAAAEFLQVGRSSLYQAMNRGELPFCKVGKLRRIPKRALVRFAADRLVGASDA
jgi:excisionase family DNA binding protein